MTDCCARQDQGPGHVVSELHHTCHESLSRLGAESGSTSKTPATRSTAFLCESETVWVYKFNVVYQMV